MNPILVALLIIVPLVGMALVGQLFLRGFSLPNPRAWFDFKQPERFYFKAKSILQPELPYSARRRFPHFQITERFPSCPGDDCPHQMETVGRYMHNTTTIGATPRVKVWTGKYCWRWTPEEAIFRRKVGLPLG